MADESWPYGGTGAPVTGETQWELLQSPLLDDGILADPGASTAQVYADGSGMLVKRRAGSAWFRGTYWRDLAEMNVTIAPNTASQPRIDRIVLHRDLQANTTTTIPLQGTPAATPAAPALTQTPGGVWEFPLAQVAVAAGVGVSGSGAAQVINSGNVTDDRAFMPVRRRRVSNQGQLPATAPLWQEAYDTSGNAWEWSGARWARTRRAGDTDPVTWIGAVRHASNPDANLAVYAASCGGKYAVSNGYVTAHTTVMLNQNIDAFGSLRVVPPVSVDRGAHPQNSDIGTWTWAGNNGEWAEGTLVIGPASIVAFTTWRGIHAGHGNLTQAAPGNGTGGSLQTQVTVGDYFTFKLGYWAA